MVSLEQLWMPIIAAAVAVFVMSSLIHMVFKWHNSEYKKLPNEDEVRAALRPVAGTPSVYFMPYCIDHKQMQAPEMLQKFKEGPNGFLSLMAPGTPSMGKPLRAMSA